MNARVILRDEVAPGLLVMRVAPEGWELPPFKAGQFAVVGLPGSAPRVPDADPEETGERPDKLIRRAYSVASASTERTFLEFYVALVRSGALTPRLWALDEGDPLWLGPKIAGLFTLDPVPPDANLVLLATGTGLAPYMSMLRTHLERDAQRRIAVLHGARHSWDLGYRDELAALAARHPQLTYLPVVSRPGDEREPWPGATGYVQELWRSHALAAAWGSQPRPADTHFLLCGNPDMIDQATSLLEEDGFRQHSRAQPGQIHAERYW